MMLNALCLVLIVAVAAALGLGASRSWRSKRSALKFAVSATAALAAAMLGFLSVAIVVGYYKSRARFAPIPEEGITVTPERVQRGQAIVSAFCGACHSSTGTLTGGRDLGEHLPLPIGRFIAANLTPAGQLSGWSDGEIFRAIRNSVDADGNLLMIMSLTNVSRLSDDDIESLIAYIRSVPAAGRPTPNPPDALNPLGLLVLGAGQLPTKPVFAGTITAPPKAATADYGAYTLSYQDCRACHGADLGGGVPGQFGAIGPSLAVVKDWRLEEFIATLRNGVDPTGNQLDSERMPWRTIGKMDDEELGAIYAYLKQLPDSADEATH